MRDLQRREFQLDKTGKNSKEELSNGFCTNDSGKMWINHLWQIKFVDRCSAPSNLPPTTIYAESQECILLCKVRLGKDR